MLFRNVIGLNWAVISSDFAPFLLGFPATVNLKAKISDWLLVRRPQLSRVSRTWLTFWKTWFVPAAVSCFKKPG